MYGRDLCCDFIHIDHHLLGLLYLWVILTEHDITVLNNLYFNGMNVI